MSLNPTDKRMDPGRADVCIVGGGAAGITLALELVGSDLDVVLLESGGESAEHSYRGIYRLVPGETIRLTTDESKPSYFGGSTNYWFGNCRPLDELDFEWCDGLPYCGWPFGLEELLPYYERAQRVAGLGDLRLYDLETCGPLLPDEPVTRPGRIVETKIEQTTPVFDLARLYQEDLTAAGNVQVRLGSHALRLRTDASGSRVTAVEVSDPDGRTSAIEAGTFILATGGVENARLLLCSNEATPAGLGNDHDLVGRFFMEHFYFAFDSLESGLSERELSDALRLYDAGATGARTEALEHRPEVEGARVFPKLSLSSDWMRQRGVPGMDLWVRPSPRTPGNVRALQRVAEDLRERSVPRLTELKEIMSAPVRSLRFLVWKLTDRFRPSQDRELMALIEQRPNPENRVRLSTRLDRFGQPEAEVDLRLAPGELEAHVRSLKAAADQLGLKGDELALALERKYAAGDFDFVWHHMGTTRMSDDPERGVVDRDCRVHGVSNLYIAGSSVFPTAGTAGPTLTLLALAIRLADHLEKELRRN